MRGIDTQTDRLIHTRRLGVVYVKIFKVAYDFANKNMLGIGICEVLFGYSGLLPLPQVPKKKDSKFCNSSAGASHKVVVTVLM